MIISNFQGVTDEVVLCRWKANPVLTSMSWDTWLTFSEIAPSRCSLLSLQNPQDVAQALEFPKTDGLDITYWTHTWFNPHCVRLQTMLFLLSLQKDPNSFFLSMWHTNRHPGGRNKVRNRRISTNQLLWLPLDFTVSHDLPGSRSLSSGLCPSLKFLCSRSQETASLSS